MKHLFLLASMAIAAPLAAFAECKIWAIEDTSVATQKRARAFVAVELDNMQAHVAQGYVIAKEIARSKRLDYIDVFVTRPQEGFNREDHSRMTSTVHIQYNPGRTPLNSGKRLTAAALEDPQNAEFSHGMLGFKRTDLDADQIDQMWRGYFGPIDFECR